MPRIDLDFLRPRTTMAPMMGLALALVTVSAVEAAPSEHWYARPECRSAYATLMTAELDAAREKIAQLHRSPDLELRACGVWLEIPQCEIELSLEGESDALIARRGRRLERLFKFAMRHGRRRPHLLDLAIEARMRRVRLMAETGDRPGALGEARKVEKMLAARADQPPTPTRSYARGLTNLAVSQSGWALRVLLKMAGIGGDEAQGRRLLESLAEGNTVYQADALFVLHHFARKGSAPDTVATERYGTRLARAYGQNPQFLFNRAVDQYQTGRCTEALATLAPARSRLNAKPRLWSARVRKKVYWLTGRCALDTGDKPLAQESLGRASQEQYGGYAEELALLLRDLRS